LGHLSFDLVSHLSGLDLVRGLPRLKFEKDLVCAPCRHGKMVATPHPPLADVMTERPTELLHMDLVGPARVRSVGEKWYVLVVVDDYSRYHYGRMEIPRVPRASPSAKYRALAVISLDHVWRCLGLRHPTSQLARNLLKSCIQPLHAIT
jgi:hypothetical protein